MCEGMRDESNQAIQKVEDRRIGAVKSAQQEGLDAVRLRE